MGKLSMIGQMKKEAERDFTKFVKYVAELEQENKSLNEKIRFLEQCLDNKEKVNISLREENKMLKEEIERLKS